MAGFISVVTGIRKEIPEVAVKGSGKNEFLNKFFAILSVMITFMSTSISPMLAAENISITTNVDTVTSRQEVMTRIDELSHTVKQELPQEISKGIRWTDFSYTQKGNLGVPAIFFTYEFDMKAIYGSECPEELLPGWLGAYAEKLLSLLRTSMKDGYRGITKTEFLDNQIGVTIILIKPTGESIGTIYYTAADIFK